MAADPPRRAEHPRPARIGPRDLYVLEFAAEHPFLLNAHARTLLGSSTASASQRLRNLTSAGWLRYERKLAGPGAYQITSRGLRVIGSTLPAPRDIDLATYDHGLGMAWVWLAASRGAFGPIRGMASERHMRSEDRRRPDPAERFGVRLGGVGPYGGERRHYPDLLLETGTGHRVAVELELTSKSRGRRDEILGGYALDSRIDAVLYLVKDRRTGLAIERSARRAGIAPRVHVQLAHFGPGSGAIGAGRGAAHRAPARAAARSANERAAGSASRSATGQAEGSASRSATGQAASSASRSAGLELTR